LLLKLLPLLVERAVKKKTAPAAVVAIEGEDAVRLSTSKQLLLENHPLTQKTSSADELEPLRDL